jgi:hypothetical protein
MDNDFRRGPKKDITPQLIGSKKALPSFRASSELPENATQEGISIPINRIPTSVQTEQDPTDLTLDREKTAEPETPEAEPPKTERQFKEPLSKKTKKKHIIILLILLVLVGLSAVGFVLYQKRTQNADANAETTTEAVVEVKKEEKPVTAPSPLTGRDLDPSLASRPVTAIMIENSPEARPQSGLVDADMVFEAVAEGGITRFIALYQESQPSYIGPIRSARPYYVDIARTFDAAYIHAGGSDDALARIDELGIKDMSAFENSSTYFRVDNRDAPHDLYSDMARIDTLRTSKGFTTSTFTPWKHKADTAQTPSARTINLSISSAFYNPSFSYDASTNSYLRDNGGSPHLDEKTQKQVQPKVVIALVTTKGQDGIYSTYRMTGSGEARIFQDGIVSNVTWTKEAPNAQFVFKDKNGLEFVFNKGQVWMSLVDSAGDITYAP